MALVRFALVLVVASLFTACGSDEPLDPTGTWTSTLTWGAGDCGETGTTSGVFTVTKGGSGYVISGSDPAVTVTGTFTCDADSCRLSAQEVGPLTLPDGTPATGNFAYNLDLDAEDRITGSGSASVTWMGGSCSQAFTVTGTRS